MHALFAQRINVQPVNQVNDLHMPGQQTLHEPHWPGFKRLGEQGVIGVGQGFDRDLPGGTPLHAVFIDQQAHQLCDGNGRMGVIELDGHVVAKIEQCEALIQMAPDQVLQRCCHEEIFLTQPQLLPGFVAVRRVQHPRNALSAHHLCDRAQVVTGIKAFEVHLVHRPGPP